MTDSLFFDSDCISAFLWVNDQNILSQLYAGKIIIPKQAYTVKEIIRSIDENFYNGLTRGDKCRVGRGISTLYNKGQIFYFDRGAAKGVTNTYHVVAH